MWLRTGTRIVSIIQRRFHGLRDSTQPVVGDAFAQVVNAMEGDICRKPMQNPRKNQIATALNRPFEVAPVVGAVGVGIRKVVLHKEDADKDRGRTGHHDRVAAPEQASAEPAAHQPPAREHTSIIRHKINEFAKNYK